MKLRLRYRQATKVFEIPQHLEGSFTVSNILSDASILFTTDFEGDFYLSLNRKDPIGEEDIKIADCGIVSGDILHIISTGDESIPAKKQNVRTEKEVNLNAEISNRPGTSSQIPQNISQNVSSTEKQKIEIIDTNIQTEAYSLDSDEKEKTELFENLPNHSDDDHEENSIMDTDSEEVVDLAIVNKCLSEPVLCREATEGRVPALLKEMVTSMQPEDGTQAICVVLHVLMLETGFMVKETNNESFNVPDTWRYPGHYKIVYTYAGCTDTQCLLTVIPTGFTLSLHGKIAGTDMTPRQFSLKVSDYIHGNISDWEKCYHQLAKLSKIFKDNIASPLVQDIRAAAGLEEIYGILALTQEMKLRILSFLDVQSLSKVCSVCQEFQDIAQDPYLWRRLYLKDFGNRTDNSLSQNWKQLYKQQYKIRKERRKMMNRFTPVVPHWGPQNPFGGPSNWIPPGPGFIGGDYDLYPNFPGSLPGIPGRLGYRPPSLPRPRYDLIGPYPDMNPEPGAGLMPRRPSAGRHSGIRNPFGGVGGPRFF